MTDTPAPFGSGFLPEGWDAGMEPLQRVLWLAAAVDAVQIAMEAAIADARRQRVSWVDIDGAMGLPRGTAKSLYGRP